jgi:RimJ/RimL family protein N-acetyltransferase
MEQLPVIFLNSERLYLRGLEDEDIPRMLPWLNDEEIRSFISMTFPLDTVQEKRFIEQRRAANYPTDLTLAIVLKDGNRHIGNCGIHRIQWTHRHGTLGIVLGEKDCWEKGYGTETEELLLKYAFDSLNFHRMNVAVFSGNQRSLNCQKKVGFQVEGTIRQAFFKNGRWEDEILLGMTAEEWRARMK